MGFEGVLQVTCEAQLYGAYDDIARSTGKGDI